MHNLSINLSIYQSINLSNKMDVTTTLGVICAAHPNVCLFANDKLMKPLANNNNNTCNNEYDKFINKEFPLACKKWYEMPFDVENIGDMSDAYWILKCWLLCKDHNNYQNDTELYNQLCSLSKYVINNIPKMNFNVDRNTDNIHDENVTISIMTEYAIMSIKQIMQNIDKN